MGKTHTTKDAILNILIQQNGSPLNYKQICSRLSIHDPSGRNHIAKSLKKLKNLKMRRAMNTKREFFLFF